MVIEDIYFVLGTLQPFPTTIKERRVYEIIARLFYHITKLCQLLWRVVFVPQVVGKFRKFAGDIFATMTAEAPTAIYTATKTPMEAVTPTPANR